LPNKLDDCDLGAVAKDILDAVHREVLDERREDTEFVGERSFLWLEELATSGRECNPLGPQMG
jgi:hypothetical protein